MCARNNVAYKYALSWMGHSSSEILDLYYREFDDVSHAAMRTIAYAGSSRTGQFESERPPTSAADSHASSDRSSHGQVEQR